MWNVNERFEKKAIDSLAAQFTNIGAPGVMAMRFVPMELKRMMPTPVGSVSE
jgi:hypothetical protein